MQDKALYFFYLHKKNALNIFFCEDKKYNSSITYTCDENLPPTDVRTSFKNVYVQSEL